MREALFALVMVTAACAGCAVSSGDDFHADASVWYETAKRGTLR